MTTRFHCPDLVSRRWEPPPEPCEYTGPVEFTPLAGFAHAMRGNREPILVAPNPVAAPALDYLNDLAGWEFMKFTSTNPEITWEVGWWGALWNGPAPYTAVTIFTPQSAQITNVAAHAHEIMHALGYDHQKCGCLGGEGVANPTFDRNLLFQEGYRTDPLPPKPPPAKGSYVCPYCGKKFGARRKLKRHVRRRHRRYD